MRKEKIRIVKAQADLAELKAARESSQLLDGPKS
jgi:hypothetical protein